MYLCFISLLCIQIVILYLLTCIHQINIIELSFRDNFTKMTDLEILCIILLLWRYNNISVWNTCIWSSFWFSTISEQKICCNIYWLEAVRNLYGCLILIWRYKLCSQLNVSYGNCRTTFMMTMRHISYLDCETDINKTTVR